MTYTGGSGRSTRCGGSSSSKSTRRKFGRCFSTFREAPKVWDLPEVPEEVRQAMGAAVVDSLVPRQVELIESREEAEAVFPDLVGSRLLGVDCEGVALGRWGRLCLCQITTPKKVFLFDALREGIIDVLRPILCSSTPVKVMHDCREDASALLSQFDIALSGIFDSQVAHTMLLQQQATRPFQISLNELLKNLLHLENVQQRPMHQQMNADPNVWFYRPFGPDLITYAAQDVMYLPLLHHKLCDVLGDPSGGRVIEKSRRYCDYARMNHHLGTPKAAEKRGLRLQAMLATQTEAALYLKLNLGAHRQGAVSRPEALSRFKDLQFGDIADCWVSAWNPTGNILFLERMEISQAIPETIESFASNTQRRPRRW